jgi:hypothetical protein
MDDPDDLTDGRPQLHTRSQLIGAHPDVTLHIPKEMVFRGDDDTRIATLPAIRIYNYSDEMIVVVLETVRSSGS